MSKQCLDVQQMQHLQELGLDTSNASLCYYKQEGWEANYFIALTCDIKEKGGLAYYYDSFGNKEYTLNEVIPAYTLQDILDMLPKRIHEDVITYCLRMETDCKENKYSFSYTQVLEDSLYITGYNENPIDSAYELLLWCIEKGFVKAEGGGK